jgi:hypothetical protein
MMAVDSSAPLLTGEEGERLRERVWREIIEALRRDVPGVDDAIDKLGGGRV